MVSVLLRRPPPVSHRRVRREEGRLHERAAIGAADDECVVLLEQRLGTLGGSLHYVE